MFVINDSFSFSSDKLVYNLTAGSFWTYKEILEQARSKILKYPFEWTLWFPDGTTTKNKFIHKLSIFLFHYVPAYFIDFLLLLFMQKRL